ncbi:MAG: hypothetical protein RL398_1531 [Planctomycetota bacterium]
MSDARIEPATLPKAVRDLARQLAAVGGRTWVVGGAVRDRLAGREPTDFDLATDLTPERVTAALPASESRDARFGVVRCEIDGREITVASLRSDGRYGDQRHPDHVEFVTEPARDAARRDFTVNAIYLDIATGELIDPLGGRSDLLAGRLRCIGIAKTRLREDPLRLLRCVRFAAGCGLELDAELRTAVREVAADVATVAAERCLDELTRMFTGPGRGRALRLLVELGLAKHLLPEVAAMDGVTQPPEYHPEGDVLTHVAMVLDHVPEGDPILAWSAVLHDVGKPPTWRLAEDRIRFDGHDRLSERMAEAVLTRLHAPRAWREAICEIIADHIRIAALPQMRPRRREAWLRTPRFPQHLAFHFADCMGSHRDLSIYEYAKAELAALPPLRPLPIDGRDVLALGVSPGPRVGELLESVADALSEAAMAWDRETALALLRDAVAASDQGRNGTSR